MLRLFAILAFFASGIPATFAQTLPGPVPAEIVRVIDGDTVRVRAKIWINQTIEVSVRVAEIDTPEVHRPACPAERKTADRATEAARAFLGKNVFLHNIHNGKYAGRVVAEVHHKSRGRLSKHLLDLGLAVAEGAKDPWCDQTHLSVATLP